MQFVHLRALITTIAIIIIIVVITIIHFKIFLLLNKKCEAGQTTQNPGQILAKQESA